jgi:hypothetical protein
MCRENPPLTPPCRDSNSDSHYRVYRLIFHILSVVKKSNCVSKHFKSFFFLAAGGKLTPKWCGQRHQHKGGVRRNHSGALQGGGANETTHRTRRRKREESQKSKSCQVLLTGGD